MWNLCLKSVWSLFRETIIIFPWILRRLWTQWSHENTKILFRFFFVFFFVAVLRAVNTPSLFVLVLRTKKICLFLSLFFEQKRDFISNPYQRRQIRHFIIILYIVLSWGNAYIFICWDTIVYSYTSYIYFYMSVLNVPISVNEFVLSFLLFVQC